MRDRRRSPDHPGPAPRRQSPRAGGQGKEPGPQEGAPEDRRGLRTGPGPRPAQFLGGPPVCTGSSTSASSSNTTPGIPSIPAGSTSTSGRSTRQGLKDGSLTEESARELLQCFWVKFNNQPAPPKVGVTAEESGTYTDFALINVGGVKADGTDAVNDLSFLLLDVIEEMRLLQPSSMVQISSQGPGRVPLAGAQDRQDRLRPALDLQHRRDRPGTGPAGQIRRGRPQRRGQRLRRGRGFRQGKLHPDRLLQHAQGPRNRPPQRLRSADGKADRSEDRRPGEVQDLRRALRRLQGPAPPFRRHQDPRQHDHRAAVRRRSCPPRSSRS